MAKVVCRRITSHPRDLLLVTLTVTLVFVLSRPRPEYWTECSHRNAQTHIRESNQQKPVRDRNSLDALLDQNKETSTAPRHHPPVQESNLTKNRLVTAKLSPTDRVTKEMEAKLSLPKTRHFNVPELCRDTMARGNSCNGSCLRTRLDEDTRTRVAQIVELPELQMRTEQRAALDRMASQVTGSYDILIVTAASDDHFNESQGLIRTLYLHVFPRIQNFTLVYYDLGLSKLHRAQLEKHCKFCQVVDFPFANLPKVFSILSCYAWKPLMVAAHHKQANVVVWLDASIRFDQYPLGFPTLINKTKERGLQLNCLYGEDVSTRTVPSLFHFFGEEPCAYLRFGELATGVMFFAREYFVERAIMEPWVACAFDRRCMCPDPKPPVDARKSIEAFNRWKNKEGPLVYGLAHRFEQSTLSLLVMKLFRERYRDIAFSRKGYLDVKRHESVSFLPES